MLCLNVWFLYSSPRWKLFYVYKTRAYWGVWPNYSCKLEHLCKIQMFLLQMEMLLKFCLHKCICETLPIRSFQIQKDRDYPEYSSNSATWSFWWVSPVHPCLYPPCIQGKINLKRLTDGLVWKTELCFAGTERIRNKQVGESNIYSL